MAEDRILTLHPEGKKGVNITRDKYEQVKAVILDALTDTPEIGRASCRERV